MEPQSDHSSTVVAHPPHEARRDASPPAPASPPRPVLSVADDRQTHRGGGRFLSIFLVLCLVGAGVGYWLWTRHARSASPAAGTQGPGGARTVPVVASPARQGDLELYVDGLGSVTAFNTVAVRPRVDGQIVNVAYQEGQHVNKGDLLVEIDPRPFQASLDQAQGQLNRDQAMLRNAQLDLERFTQAGQAVTQQQVDTQRALVQQDQGIVQADQAAVDNAKLQLSYCRVTAPITGRAGLRLVDIGNIVRASDANSLVVLTQLQPISVVFSIPQEELPRVLQKMNAGQTLTVDALDQTLRNKLASGTLTAVDNQVDASTGTVRLKSVFANQDGVLFPNEFVNARLSVDRLHDVVLVPAAAVQRGPSAAYVYVVGPDQTVVMRNVTIGPTEGDQTVIESGVSAGETVVTDGVDKLQQGSKVTVSAPGATTRPSRAGPGGGGGGGGANRAGGANGAGRAAATTARSNPTTRTTE